MKNDLENEAIFVDKLVLSLQKYFTIEKEVWSDCRKGRIDLVLTTKDGFKFGVECKRNDNKRGEEIGEFIKQALRYKEYLFNGVKIPIFIAPPISYNYFIMNQYCKKIESDLWHKDRHDENHDHHTVNGFLGALGIGEIRKNSNYFYLSFSNKIIWSSQKGYKTGIEKGTHLENYSKLMAKL